jgi:DNA-binding SARP family transcriptional activator
MYDDSSAEVVTDPSAAFTRGSGSSVPFTLALFGGLRIDFDGNDVAERLPGRQGRALVAYLVLNRDRPVSRDELLDVLWRSQPPAAPDAALNSVLAKVRRALGPGLITGRRALVLQLPPDAQIDVQAVSDQIERAERALANDDPATALQAAQAVLEVLDLALLPDLDGDWIDTWRRRFDELAPRALEIAAQAGMTLGDSHLPAAERVACELVVREPFREAGYALLMQAQALQGNVAEALRTFEQVRVLLRDELGAKPSPSLLALHDSLLREDVAATRSTTRATPASAARQVRFRLPLAAAHFTGRSAELDALDEALGVAERAVVTQAITGLGGVGKSQLAACYVHEHVDEYDVVAWIRAEDGGIADLSELAAELGLPVAQLTPAQCAASAMRWLGGCEERWLLVLDNVAGPEQLSGCCPSSGNGRVIITTRDRAMAQFGAAVRVDVFDEATAVEYLLATSGRAGNRDGAVRLARALGCLPLALSHAAAYCAAGTSFDDYLELLEALPAAELFDRHPETSYAQTVASTWHVSIQAAERTSPLARRVLAMAAHLAPDALPRKLFEVLLNDASTPTARKELLDAFNALHRLSLAQVDDAAISVHRLLQKTIRDDALRRGDMTAAVSALAAVTAAFPETHDQPQTWPQSERLLPHVLAIAAVLAKTGEENEQLVTLLIGASAYLLRADSGVRAVDTATRANACAERLLGPEHPETLSARACLAVAYYGAGYTTEAIDLGEQVLAARERILGPEHPDTLTTGANLSHHYWEAGRITHAIELGERVLADCERILGPEHPDTLTATRTIIAVSYDAAGRTADAIQLGERLVTDSQRILGPEHPDTLVAGVLLGLAYRAGGRVDEAIELGQRALADCERILGPEHHHTLRASSILAFSYRAGGRVDEAIELAQRVLADLERILGPEHPETLRARMIVAFSYRAAGRLDEAIELGQRVLAESERVLGPEHLYTLRARMILAVSYHAGGRADEAIELGERVLAETVRILGTEHPDTRRARTNLADSYATAGRKTQALEPRDHPNCRGSNHPV